MTMRILAILATLLACLGFAYAHDQPQVFPQLGHSGPFSAVWSVAFSPDGQLLASGSSDKTIRLWEVESGRELRSLSGHSDWVEAVAFSPDGRLLASGSRDGTVKLWELVNGRELRTLSGHSRPVTSVVFSPNGRMLASGSWDKTVKLWDVTSGNELRSLDGDSEAVNSVALSPDGHILAAGGNKGIKLWDLASGRELLSIPAQSNEIHSVAFSPDGRTLVSGHFDGVVKLWDLASGRVLRTLRHSVGVYSLAFSPDGRVLASGSEDKTARLWDVASGRELRTLRGHADGVSSVAFSPDGRKLASGSGDTTIKLWEGASGRELRTLTGHSKGLDSVAVSSDGRILGSAAVDGTINLWDLTNGRKLLTLRGQADYNPIAFSPDGRMLSAAATGGTVTLLDATSGRQLRILPGDRSTQIISIAFSPDGRFLASGILGTVKLWDVATWRPVQSFHGHGIFAFSQDGRILATAGDNRTITLWDIATGRELRAFRGQRSHESRALEFSPDGRILASGSGDGSIRLWDVASGGELRTLNARPDMPESATEAPDGVGSIAFSLDGGVVVVGTFDGAVSLWDVASGRQLRVLSGHSDWVTTVAFAHSGHMLVSGSLDSTIRLWDWPKGTAEVSLIAFTDGSSLAITPEGYYDASSGAAEENINVRLGNRVFPIAAYRDGFYRPDLVRLSLAGNSLSGLGFAGIGSVKVAPVVEFVDLPSSTSAPKLEVSLRLVDGGGGIGQVRLYLNGTAVVQDNASAPSRGGTSRTHTYTVQLADGPNVLQAEAYNADNNMHSDSPAVPIIANLPPANRSNLHAVVVGIQEFENPKLSLRYAAADAQLFAETLRKYSAPLFKTVDVRLLTSPADTARDALIKAIRDMQPVVTADDLFVFYVASHGFADDGEYFLITSNVGSLSTDHLKTDAVSKEELTALIANIAATKKLMVIDTCQAEALGNALQAGLMTRGLDEVTALKILSRAVGTTVLAASTSTQEALEGYEDHGLFSYVVAEGLKGKGAVDKSGIVNTLGLAQYVDTQVPELALHHFNHHQYPTVETNGQAFPLTRVK